MDEGPGTKSGGEGASASLDPTGLPVSMDDGPRTLVQDESPEEWSHRFQAWIDSHPTRPSAVDDSREGIYDETPL